MSQTPAITPDQFTSFGELLQFLRHRAGWTQQEFAVRVGYSPSQISRLEKNQRVPDAAAVAARFVPELDLAQDREWVARLLELAASFQGESQPGKAVPQAPTHNLRLQVTRFIGREKELAEIKELLTVGDRGNPFRLLTLTGAGGSGKTRLAVQAAAERLADFEDGVWFVDLAPVTDPALVILTVMQTLRVTPFPDQTPLEALKDSLRHKHLLLVLDNFEHLLVNPDNLELSNNFEQVLDAAVLLTELLSAAPALVLLVTSRAGLHLSAEQEFLVPPLPLPDIQSSVDVLSRNAAVDLFVQRARAVQKDFQLTAGNASAVAEICVRLDGLPLAIELAAARTKVLAPDALLARLTNRFGLLTGGARDVPARQQTLRNTIDWSYQLLKPKEQTLFKRLGVFTGGWTLEAAEQICHDSADDAADIVDRLDTLLSHNLVLRQTDIDG